MKDGNSEKRSNSLQHLIYATWKTFNIYVCVCATAGVAIKSEMEN